MANSPVDGEYDGNHNWSTGRCDHSGRKDTDTDPEMSIEEENIGEAVEEEETEMDVLDEVPEEILEEEITEWQMKQKGLEGPFYQFLVE